MGLKRKEELCDEHGIVFQNPDFGFLLSEIRTIGECEHVVSLIVSDSGTFTLSSRLFTYSL